MSKNELKILEKLEIKRKGEDVITPVKQVKYELVDATHYSFTHEFNDDIHLKMDEYDQDVSYTDFMDADYEEDVIDSNKPYYVIAASSGILTGVLFHLYKGINQIEKADEWNDKDWKHVITATAKFSGYKKDDFKGSVKHLINKSVVIMESNIPEEKRQQLISYLSCLSANPTLSGLVFSIISQYSGKKYYFADDGELDSEKLPAYYAIGQTPAEKIIYGILYWVFNLAVDAALSKRHILDEIGIPKGLISIIKDICALEIVQKIPENVKDAEKLFSEYLKNLFEKSGFTNENDGKKQKFNVFSLIKDTIDGGDVDIVPVLLNECIIRGFYLLRRLYISIKENSISSFADLNKIDPQSILPINNRVVTRMGLISSTAYMGVNLAGATIKALANKSANKRPFSQTLMMEIDIAGVGRFIFACAADCKYWSEDIKIAFEKMRKRSNKGNKHDEFVYDSDAFDILTLDAMQARLLGSLEVFAVEYDIEHTKDKENAEIKEEWCMEWKNRILQGFGCQDDYFITDENLIYDGIYELSKNKDNWGWFYLLGMEMALFKPYGTIGSVNDNKYKKLKATYDYIEDQFIRKQTIITQKEVDTLKKSYSKYSGIISGSTQKKIAAPIISTAVVAATGAAAFVCAPGIAIAIAGEAVAGLHGAALTSASLAFIGGGSLAAGGLGMAGGTAIITGGGALVGLVGSGTASVATILSQTPSEYWVRQSAKLLTYSDSVLSKVLNDTKSIKNLQNTLEYVSNRVKTEIEEYKQENNDLDKDLIKKSSEYLKYLKKSINELDKISKNV